jgi:hypothetical protein
VLHQPAPLARAEFNLFFLLSVRIKNYKSTQIFFLAGGAADFMV